MAKTTGKTGAGVFLELLDTDSPPSFATVANVTNIEAGGRTLETVDATHLASPDKYREFLSTLKTADDWTATVQWDPNDPTLDNTTGLGSRLESGEETTLRVNFSALGTGYDLGLEADGFVTNLGSITIGVDTLMTQPFTFKPTGAPRIVTITP